MQFEIRKMNIDDRDEILSMMREFYSSDAVFTNGSEEIFETDFKNCINENPYLVGFVFSFEGRIAGYSMIAKSFSTEYGKPCIWLEDLYIKPEFRGRGIISNFISYIKEKYKNSIFKLEVEDENAHAIYVYKKIGFETLPYKNMKMEV